MRWMFLAATVCALAVAAFGSEVLQAKCRCDRGTAKAARQQSRYDRKCQRRGICQPAYYTEQQQPGTYYNPYGGDAITPLGPQAATVETEVVWRCGPRGCYPVRVPIVKPTPDPAFKDVQAIPAKPKTPQTKTPPKAEANLFPPGVINGT